MRHPSLLLVALAGCWYHAGSFDNEGTPFPGARVQTACLDASLTLAQDRRATEHVLAYSFGNRCSHAAIVDLPGVPVVGRDADGSKHPLKATDPKDELRALPLDAGWHGYEEIEYSAREDPAPRDVCADLGRLERVADPVDDWVCLAMTDEGGAL